MLGGPLACSKFSKILIFILKIFPGLRIYDWNHPGGTSLLAECHQIMFTVELLPSSFFDENARVLLRLSNEGERTENM